MTIQDFFKAMLKTFTPVEFKPCRDKDRRLAVEAEDMARSAVRVESAIASLQAAEISAQARIMRERQKTYSEDVNQFERALGTLFGDVRHNGGNHGAKPNGHSGNSGNNKPPGRS